MLLMGPISRICDVNVYRSAVIFGPIYRVPNESSSHFGSVGGCDCTIAGKSGSTDIKVRQRG